MPIYQYRCKECGYEFETLVNPGEQVKCQRCKSKNLKKLISRFSTGSKEKSCGVCSGKTCSLCR